MIKAIIPVSSFENSKTRLSPFLTKNERKELLKSMLKDICKCLESFNIDTTVISKDDEVLEYAKKLDLNSLKEKKHSNNYLNNAIKDAIETVSDDNKHTRILILPADIPLINEDHINYILDNSNDLIISPSMGGGTNLLCINNDYDFEFSFGENSYFKHIKQTKQKSIDYKVLDSFFLSLDVNTPTDLGEIILHGVGTSTYEYLRSINLNIEFMHGSERLYVYREVPE